jgi:hypothetical protein
MLVQLTLPMEVQQELPGPLKYLSLCLQVLPPKYHLPSRPLWLPNLSPALQRLLQELEV